MNSDSQSGVRPQPNVEELRSFLGSMHEKSPEEVLGLPLKSELLQLTLVAALGVALLLLMTTGVYFLFGGAPKPDAPTVAASESPEDQTTVNAEAPATGQTTTADTPPQSTNDASKPDAAIDAMGIGEAKAADPDENPLESGIDDLLKGIE